MGKKTGIHKVKKQTTEKTLYNDKTAFDLRVKGWSQLRIAEHLGVSQSAISLILTRVNAKYAKNFMSKINDVKTEQVAQHQFIIDESMGAWTKSKNPRKRKNKDGEVEQISAHGDARYLDTAMRAMESIRKILGVHLIDPGEDKDQIFGKVMLEVIDKRYVDLLEKTNAVDKDE